MGKSKIRGVVFGSPTPGPWLTPYPQLTPLCFGQIGSEGGQWKCYTLIARAQTTEARLIASLRLASVSLMMEKIEQKIAYDGKSRRTRGDGGGGGCLSLVTAL